MRSPWFNKVIAILEVVLNGAKHGIAAITAFEIIKIL
jgi:hypothetical protein